MKRLVISFVIPLAFILAGCSSYIYKANVKPDNISGGKLDPGSGYIYGVYGYAVRSPIFFGHEPYLVLDLIPKSMGSAHEQFIALDANQGYFFASLTPGDYTLHRIVLNMEGQDFDSVVIDKDFTVASGTIFYLGNFKTEFLRNTQPYVWWGVKSIDDQFQGDTTGLIRDYTGLTAANLVNGYSSLGAGIKPFEKRDIFENGSQPQFHAKK